MPTSSALEALAEELAREKAKTRARVLAKLRSLYRPSTRWELPDPRARGGVPNSDLGRPKDCVARSLELAPRAPRWEDP